MVRSTGDVTRSERKTVGHKGLVVDKGTPVVSLLSLFCGLSCEQHLFAHARRAGAVELWDGFINSKFIHHGKVFLSLEEGARRFVHKTSLPKLEVSIANPIP